MKALPEKKRQNKQTKVRMQNALVNASRSKNLVAINQKIQQLAKATGSLLGYSILAVLE